MVRQRKFKCENDATHVLKRPEGTTRTKCGFCGKSVRVTLLPENRQIFMNTKEPGKYSGASLTCWRKREHRSNVDRRLSEGLSERVSISGPGD